MGSQADGFFPLYREGFMQTIHEFVSAYRHLQQARDVRDAGFQWRIELEGVLRRVCDAWPNHTNQNLWGVRARVVLVDQYLNANLGGYDEASCRAKASCASKGIQREVAEQLVEQGTDDIIRPLTRVATFDADSLPIIINVHASIVKVVQLVTNRREQSFCAKYLSVPFPNTVPRLDSKAEAVSERLVGHLIDRSRFEDATNRKYAQHCQRILLLMGELRNGGVVAPELLLLDHLLWKAGGGYAE
jgi:hypothetical protein